MDKRQDIVACFGWKTESNQCSEHVLANLLVAADGGYRLQYTFDERSWDRKWKHALYMKQQTGRLSTNTVLSVDRVSRKKDFVNVSCKLS